MEKYKVNKKFVRILTVLIVLACVSVFIVSLSIGKPKNQFWQLNLELENPTSFYCQNEGPENNSKVVIDQDGKRVSLINSSNKVYSQVFFDSTNNILSYANKALIYNNELYLYGYTTNETLSKVEKIKIVKYSLDGEYLGELATYDYYDEQYMFVYNMKVLDNILFLTLSQ